MLLTLTLLLYTQISHAASPYLKEVGECLHPKPNTPTVYIIKQWHLASNVNTHDQTKQLIPQAANQAQIYRQLEEWLQQKKIDTVIAEGCEGEIDATSTPPFKTVFNGWSMDELKKKASDPGFADIATHAVVKLEAKYGTSVRSLCGDSEAEMKNTEIALSDARGDAGYLGRLMQNQKDPQAQAAKTYLEGTIDALKLKPQTTVPEAIAALKKDLKKVIQQFLEADHRRNEKAVEVALKAQTQLPIPIVFGGLHGNDLKKLLEKKGAHCKVFEPVSYQNQEEKFMTELQKQIK